MVANELRNIELPENVTVIDFGIRARDFSYELLNDWKTVIVVDAASRGHSPGTLFIIEPEEFAKSNVFDAGHTMNPLAAIEYAVSMGAKFERVTVVACEPENLDEGMGLSPTVEFAIPKAVSLIRALIAQK